MLVLVDDSCQAVVSAYVEVGYPIGFGDRLRGGAERCCLVHGLVGPVRIVVLFKLVERVAEMALVPDESSVEEFTAKCLHPVPPKPRLRA